MESLSTVLEQDDIDASFAEISASLDTLYEEIPAIRKEVESAMTRLTTLADDLDCNLDPRTGAVIDSIAAKFEVCEDYAKEIQTT